MGRRRRNARRREGGTAVKVEDVDDKWWRVDGSDGSARSSRPVPASEGRALHRELLGGRNTARKLMCREIGQLRGRMPPRPDVIFCTEKFRRFKLQEQFFVPNGMEHPLGGPTVSIIGMTAANGFIFVVASSGVCMAFRQTENGSIAPYRRDGRIWYFNNHGEPVTQVFYNKINDSIIIVASTWHGIGYRTRALPLESIRRCDHSDNGVQIFEVTSRAPAFYDDSNISLVRHDTPSVYNVHEMNDYNFVYSFGSKNILFVRPRPGILIVAYTSTETYLPLFTETYLPIEILSTENWAVLKKINYAVPPSGIGLVWISQDNILLREVGKKTIHMINIWDDNTTNLIEQTNDQKLISICDLTAKRLLIRFNKNIVVASSNSHDEQVTLLEDDEVPGYYNNTKYFNSDTYVTSDNNYAMIYSRRHIEMPRDGINIQQESSCIGSINICNTFSGESVWKINPCDDVELGIAKRIEGSNNMTNIHGIIHEALQDVTTLFYDEKRHIIYTGNNRGFFHVWSN